MIRPSTHPDWQDSYAGPTDAQITTARDAYETGFRRLPAWVGWALAARNKAVQLFGLKTRIEGREEELMLALPVLQETPEAYEVGIHDKHLTFTILTERTGTDTRLTTSIWFNHWTGRTYLALVYIPHKIIVRLAVKALSWQT